MVEDTLAREDATLHWWADGGVGPFVVFTHGGAMDHRMWQSQVRALAPRARVVTHDVRGHGCSRCAGPSFSLESAADDLIAVMNAAGADRAVLVGHSCGATISQLVALKQPERVRGIVGIGAACVTTPAPFVARVRQAINPVALGLLGQPRLRAMVARMAGTRPDVKRYARETVDALSDEVFAAVMRTGFGTSVPVPDGYTLGVPLLLLRGEKEPYGAFLWTAPRWAARDGGRIVIVPGAAHNANQDAPEFVNRELARFLDELDPRA